MIKAVYVVTEGEAYYLAWIPHVVFSDPNKADEYAKDLIQKNESVRWSNVSIYKFVLDVAGFEDVKVLDG